MSSLMVDFIISLDGYGAAEGWPGYWGMEGPEYLAFIGDDAENEHTALMGATTYRLMSGFAAQMPDEPGFAALTAMPKVVFSSTLKEPLSWANTELVDGDAVEAVREMKQRDARAPAHARQRQPLPVAARGRRGRPLPRGRLPGDHRRDREGPHLRRLSRRRPRAGRAAARSTAGCSCSSTCPRSWTGRLAPAIDNRGAHTIRAAVATGEADPRSGL